MCPWTKHLLHGSLDVCMDLLPTALLPRVQNQKFRKGVGGQRGLARRNPSKARDLGLFSVPFFLCLLRRMGTHFWRSFGVLLGVCLSPTPSCQPLFETSDKNGTHSTSFCSTTGHTPMSGIPKSVSVAMQSLAVKKNFFLCKFWAVKNFKLCWKVSAKNF